MKEEPELGLLEKVDLRGPWPREDTGFTPWLAKQENLKLLGEYIGMDLSGLKQKPVLDLLGLTFFVRIRPQIR